jgi:hypothetical protein
MSSGDRGYQHNFLKTEFGLFGSAGFRHLAFMGKRGPRPQPTTLKALRGTIRTPDRRRGPDALAPGCRLVAPNYFTPLMRKRWRQILRDAR